MSNEIAVLMPVNIETRFLAPDAGHPLWRVKVRVTPDEISLNRHRPLPTEIEAQLLRDLRAAWQAQAPALTLDVFLTTHDSGKALWKKLCDAVRPPRAAWLVAFTAKLDLDTMPIDNEDQPNRVDGFPDRIEVWAAITDPVTGQVAPKKIGTGGRVEHGELVFALPKDDEDAWWNSWDKAVELGLGIECQLSGEPDKIEALYVLGLSEDSPAAFFADRVASGDFAVAEPGTPTNTVDGEPAVDLAADPETWQKIVARRLDLDARNATAVSRHSGPLTGKDDALGVFPQPASNSAFLGQTLIEALYPALWGHALKDIWGLGAEAHKLLDWMRAWVSPGGHLEPIRVRDLPYGLVPATSLNRWTLGASETLSSAAISSQVAAVEPPLVAALKILRRDLAARARTRGTTVDADSDTLVTLVGRTPTATGYSHQSFMATELLVNVLKAFGDLGSPQREADFKDSLAKRYAVGRKIRRRDPERFYLAFGNLRDIGMPLILPTFLPDVPPEKSPDLPLDERAARFIDLLERLGPLLRVDEGALLEALEGVLTDSLLFRLLIQSSLHARADAVRAGAPAGVPGPLPGRGDGPQLEPVSGNDRPLLWQWAEPLTLAGPPGTIDLNTPAGRTYERVRRGIETLGKLVQEGLDQARAAKKLDPLRSFIDRLERSFQNTLETAATRIDPFAAGLAWRRLTDLRADAATRFRLGIYGWVDAPKRGTPGPKPGGLLHAPSHTQLVTSIILRDRYLKERDFDGGTGQAWKMDITSQHVRMAEEIADEVRLGAHIYEALGRRVEAIIDDPVRVRELRETVAPQRAGAGDRFTVCHGEKMLQLHAGGTLPPWVTAAQKIAIGEWAAAMDVYADLLVAQGVHQTVTRRHEAASGTMNAAAGFGLPPELGVIETPRSGQSVLSSVLSVLPFVPAPPLTPGSEMDARPVMLADASVADYLDTTFGPATSWSWTFQIKGPAVSAAGAPVEIDESRSVTLADLGLAPADSVLFPAGKLELAASQIARDQAVAGLPEAGRVAVSDRTTQPDPDRHRLARELVVALSGRPFEFHQFHLPNSPERAADLAGLDEPIRDDLLERLAALVTSGRALLVALADPAQAATASLLALRWGIVPIDRTATVEDRARQAHAALEARLQKAEDFQTKLNDAAATQNAAGRATRTALAEIAEAIGALASPEGQLAILSRVNKATLQNYEPALPIASAPQLDEEWLTVLAPTRPRLARLEAIQLEPLRPAPPAGFKGFTAFASRPDDPWQTKAVTANRKRTKDGLALQPSRLIAAYGTSDAWDGAEVAAGVVDSWSETVPEPRHTTQAAFHFNAPGARAPQAVLLAVPPVLDQGKMDISTLLEIVRETRELAHARMAALEDLGDYDAVLPLTLLSTPEPWTNALLNDGTTITF